MKKLIILLITLIIVIAQSDTESQPPQETERERMTVITACWILTILDQAKNAQLLENLLYVLQKQVPKFNRARSVEKIQVEMVRQCFRVIPLGEAENVIDALTDKNITPREYDQVVNDFDYSQFATNEFSDELDKFGLFLREMIFELEKSMGKYFSSNPKSQQVNETKIFGFSSMYLLYIFIIFGFIIAIYCYIQVRKPVEQGRRKGKANRQD